MEKPLHVRVAEALGCKPSLSSYAGWQCGCPEVKGDHYRRPHAAHAFHEDCCHSHSGLGCDPDALARYDTDWSATGPLIEKHMMMVNGCRKTGQWSASAYAVSESGPTPLVAVCNLLLALAEAGRLRQ